MNEIFPFCGYFFVADYAGSVSPGKIHRAGKHYNEFYLTQGEAEDEWLEENLINRAVGPHLEELQEEGMISTKAQ
jgi:hypothetical protein